MVATQWGCLLLTHLRHARLTTLQRKKSQSVLLQSVARRLYKDRSLTMGRQKRRAHHRDAQTYHIGAVSRSCRVVPAWAFGRGTGV